MLILRVVKENEFSEEEKNLVTAIITADTKAIQYYLDKNIDLKGRDLTGIINSRHHSTTPLIDAIGENNIKVVWFLLNHEADPNRTGEDKYKISPLKCAAGYENLEIMDLLVKNGADVNLEDGRGLTPIFSLFKPSRPINLDLVKYLIKNGADIYTKYYKGTSFSDILTSQNIDVGKLLFQLYADDMAISAIDFVEKASDYDLTTIGANQEIEGKELH